MKKMLKRLCTGFLALATVVTALPTTPVHAESKQYWTESAERVGIIEKVMNDGSIGSTFNEGYMKVEGETAYCIDINTDFKNGYKTRADASSRMSADQISDVALSLEYVKQYGETHKELNYKQVYLLEQCVVWQRLSVHLGWQCDNVRASYDEIPKATQDEVFSGARAFVKENKGRYECGGYIYSGEGQELGQFWAKLNVGNAKLQKTSSNTSITDGNGNYSIAGATYGVFADKDCTKQLATLTTDENGNTDVVEVKADTVYIKELSAPAGYKVDTNIYSLKVEAGKTATLNVSDTPKVTDTLIELFKIDMETQKDNPQGNASLAGAEFTWKYYTGFYNKDNLPAEATRTWVTKTIAETDSDGTIHYVTKLADTYKVSGDSFYMQDGKAVLPLGTLTVEETKAPNGYLLDGAYMQAGDKSEQIKGLYLTQITEDGDLAVLTGSNQFSVSDKVIRGGVKIQKRDLETGDTKPQGSATLKDTAFDIISLNDNAVLVEGKLYKKNEVVKIIRTDIEGIASTSADLLPYVFMVPVFVLYFLWLKKLGRTQSFLHTAAVFVFGYYLFGLLTVTGIGFTSTMTFRPNISWTPFIGMITGPIDTILNIILFVPLGFFLPLLYKKYHHMKTVALTGFLFSLAVEIVQMFGWGSSDINDLMTNTAGACIGFLVYCLLSRILPANLKKQLQSSRVNAVAEVLLFAICTFAIMVTAQTWFVHDVLNVP